MAGKVFPAKGFNYLVEVDGIVQLLCQTVQRPKKEVEKVEHGAGNTRVKTAGQAFISDDLVLGMLISATGADKWANDWINSVQNTKGGTGDLPQFYEKDIVIKQLAPNGSTVEAYLYTGCFIIGIEHSEMNSTSSDNSIKTVTISVDDVERII